MNFLVTAGPTYEPLDEVRRLTNFSTGKLGSELANFLVTRQHSVTLLLGWYAAYRGSQAAQELQTFTTTADLARRLEEASEKKFDGLFHAAAVSDFAFGRIWEATASRRRREVKAAKVSTGKGCLLAELVPTLKIIGRLREWFPSARLVGWKYEMDGDRARAIAKAEKQLVENKTDACVANGRAYGEGFGLVTAPGRHLHLVDQQALFVALANLLGA